MEQKYLIHQGGGFIDLVIANISWLKHPPGFIIRLSEIGHS